jgi:hypothetical protein
VLPGVDWMRLWSALIAAALALILVACSGPDAVPTNTPVPRTSVARAAGKLVTDIEEGITPTPGTATPTVLVPTTTPQPFARLAVDSYRVYTDSIGSIWVAGLATNTGNTMAVNTGATLHLLGADGKLLVDTYATVILDELAPGESTPFRGIFANPPKGWASVKVELRASAPEILRPQVFVRGLTATDVTSAPGEGYLGATVSGKVTNNGKDSAISVRAITVALDPSGKVLEIADGYATLPELKPGSSSPFSTQFTELDKVDRYKVFLQGRLPPRQ